MTESTNGFTENDNAVSDVIGELLMTAVAFLAFGIIAVFVLSFQGTTMTHVDIDGWVDVNDDTVYLRHSGGNNVDTSYIRILLNINGTGKELSPDDVYAILGSSTWGLADTIVINTSQLWSITISEGDHVDGTIVHTGENIVMVKSVLLGEVSGVIEMTGIPTPTPTPTPTPAPTPTPTPTIQTFTPTSVSDTSGGDATIGQVGTDGDGLYTVYRMPKTAYDETVYQQFNFNPGLTSSPTQVLVRINHIEANADNVKIQVWEQDASVWHDVTITQRSTWTLDEVDVSSYIDTQNDINNLKVRYLAYSKGANKISNIEYVEVYVEWLV